MSGVDAINGQSLYFAAAQSASSQQAKETSKQKKSSATGKTSFLGALKKSNDEFELVSEGLPPEIAGMSQEEAIIFLKDEVDIAADNLKANPNLAQIELYRQKLGNFMRYVSKNNYEVLTKRRPGRDRRTGKPAYYVQIRVINEKLEKLTSDLLYNHSETINILARVEEINGLIVDLLAS